MLVHVEFGAAAAGVEVCAEDSVAALQARAARELGLQEDAGEAWDLHAPGGGGALTDVQGLCDGDALQVVLRPGWVAKERLKERGRTLAHADEFVHAAESGDRDDVALFIEARPYLKFALDAQNSLGFTAFAAAVRAEDLNTTRMLLPVTPEPYALVHRTRSWAGAVNFTPLHFAAAEGNVELVKLLLAHKDEPDVTDGRGLAPLGAACRRRQADVAKYLLTLGADPNRPQLPQKTTPLMAAVAELAGDCVHELLAAHDRGDVVLHVDAQDSMQRTALFDAAARGFTQGVQMLLAPAGAFAAPRSPRHVDPEAPPPRPRADPNVADAMRRTPLHIALDQAREGAARALLACAATARADALDEYGRAPLHIAAHVGMDGVVGVLLEDDAVRAAVDRADGERRTAVFNACKGRHEGVLARLIAAGAGVNAPDRYRRTPLHAAAEGGRAALDCVRQLLGAGADTAAIDALGATPMSCAASSGCIDVVKLLLLFGAAAAPPQAGRDPAAAAGIARGDAFASKVVEAPAASPLCLAARVGARDVVDALLEHGADPRETGEHGRSAAHFAVAAKSAGVVQALLKCDAGCAEIADDARTGPLAAAVKTGVLELVKAFLDGGADPSFPPAAPPLAAAIDGGHHRIATALLAAGADANAAGPGGPPLCRAAATAPVELVEQMLRLRADPGARDERGRTAAEVAHDRQRWDVVALLEGHARDA